MKNILLSALMLFALSSFSQAAGSQPVMKITDIKGVTHQITGTEEGFKIKGLEGKIVFLEFFGHKCPPCLASIPHLIKLQKKYKDKLAIVSIEVQGMSETQLKQFVKEKGMNYIIVSNSKAGNFTNYISQRAQWTGSIPFMVALDKKGNVQFVQAGMLPEASLEELIRQLDAIK
ncbi:TlpA family protein disulfide reductase [Sulfurovum riftiae]|uniref:Thioredoxin n=1 Tax=Sulfurovum riftiae TaxID=1630136 RepID=A0A151CDF1_9BACT|nr:TlpA disulfide reductase family protein [Sulfurovum riftiae]KYJ85548.1 thioredoxin [Sulfurovum riftiae]